MRGRLRVCLSACGVAIERAHLVPNLHIRCVSGSGTHWEDSDGSKIAVVGRGNSDTVATVLKRVQLLFAAVAKS